MNGRGEYGSNGYGTWAGAEPEKKPPMPQPGGAEPEGPWPRGAEPSFRAKAHKWLGYGLLAAIGGVAIYGISKASSGLMSATEAERRGAFFRGPTTKTGRQTLKEFQ